MNDKHVQPPISPDCERIRELLSSQLDRPLSASEERELQSHLGACDDCRSLAPWFAQVETAAEAIPVDEPGEEYFEALAAAVVDRITSEGPAVTEPSSRGSSWLARFGAPAWIAVAAAALMVGVLSWQQLGDDEFSPSRDRFLEAQSPTPATGGRIDVGSSSSDDAAPGADKEVRSSELADEKPMAEDEVESRGEDLGRPATTREGKSERLDGVASAPTDADAAPRAKVSQTPAASPPAIDEELSPTEPTRELAQARKRPPAAEEESARAQSQWARDSSVATGALETNAPTEGFGQAGKEDAPLAGSLSTATDRDDSLRRLTLVPTDEEYASARVAAVALLVDILESDSDADPGVYLDAILESELEADVEEASDKRYESRNDQPVSSSLAAATSLNQATSLADSVAVTLRESLDWIEDPQLRDRIQALLQRLDEQGLPSAKSTPRE